jgi:hypothetical protein
MAGGTVMRLSPFSRVSRSKFLVLLFGAKEAVGDFHFGGNDGIP